MLRSLVLVPVLFAFGCDPHATKPESTTGVVKATANVKPTAAFGGKKVTSEQFNILERYKRDNDSTATKHLYVISAYSGDCLLYSTVRGKVTSSGKRLTPYSVAAQDGQYVGAEQRGVPVTIGGLDLYTPEVLQDDGTYGSSIHYLYWFDARSVLHKHYISGGQIVHVSDTPMAWPKIILNLETQAASKGK